MTGVFETMFPGARGRPIALYSFASEEAAFRTAAQKIAGPPRSQTLGKSASERDQVSALLDERRDIFTAIEAMAHLIAALDVAVTKAELTRARELRRHGAHVKPSNQAGAN